MAYFKDYEHGQYQEWMIDFESIIAVEHRKPLERDADLKYGRYNIYLSSGVTVTLSGEAGAKFCNEFAAWVGKYNNG